MIPHLYEEHGPGFVERLDGMFALALWDAPRERLLLARDRLGKKPLVWTRLEDGTLAFASELKALLALPGVRAEPDLAALDAYLALQYVPGERTGLKGVQRLPPGHLLVAEGGEVHVERYWRPGIEDEQLRDEEWLERVRETVAQAVRKRLVADVPLGALLSGGIDSAVVVALMAQASAEPVRTFTVGFADAAYDERPYARAVAERWGTRHTEVLLEPDAAATLPRLAEAFDEPLGDEAALPLFLICEAARREVTVALVGDGGDESFAGYERYAAMGLAERVPRAGRLARRAARARPAGRARRAALDRVPRRALPRGGGGAARRALRTADAGLPARGAGRALDGGGEGGARPAALARPAAREAARSAGSPGCSSSTSRPTSPATCCRSPTSPRWRTRSSCARRCSTGASSSSACRCPSG